MSPRVATVLLARSARQCSIRACIVSSLEAGSIASLRPWRVYIRINAAVLQLRHDILGRGKSNSMRDHVLALATFPNSESG